MKGINLGRVILGGLLAGVLINVSEFLLNTKVLKAEMDAAMKALGRTTPETTQSLVVWMLFGFATGIALIWLYAAIRPRYGAGAGTAARAGVYFWFLMSLCVSIMFWNLGLFPLSILGIGWELVQFVLAAVVGAWVYKEDGAAA